MQALLNSFLNCFAAAGYMEFFVDMLYMGANCFIADKYFIGNRFIVISFHHQFQNFFFPVIQIIIGVFG